MNGSGSLRTGAVEVPYGINAVIAACGRAWKYFQGIGVVFLGQA
jgi:hypothetical protein